MNKETFRMQMLAGIITEGQYKEKINEESTITPEQVVDSTSKIISKIKNDPKIDALAASIANDPKKKQDLLNAAKKLGINPFNLNENSEDFYKKLGLIFAKKLENETNSLDEEADMSAAVGLGFGGLIAGMIGASYLAQQLGMFVTEYVNVWGDTLVNPDGWVPLAGAAAGAIGGFIFGAILEGVFGDSN